MKKKASKKMTKPWGNVTITIPLRTTANEEESLFYEDDLQHLLERSINYMTSIVNQHQDTFIIRRDDVSVGWS